MKTLLLLLAAALAQPAGSAETIVKIAAKVGGEIITTADVEQAVKVLASSMSASERASEEGKKKLQDARKQVLDNMVEQKLVVLAAKDGPPGFKEAAEKGQGGNNPYLPGSVEIEEEMEKAFDEARRRYPSEDAFEAALASERLTIPELRNHLRESLRDKMTYERMANLKQRDFRPSLRVSDEEAKAFYEENKSRFATAEQVELRHLMLKSADEALAGQLMARLKAAKDAKAEFVALCKKHSADEATKAQGGRLGWVERGQSEPEVDAAIFAVQGAGLAGPVETPAGIHLLYVEGHKDAEQKTFEAVKENARNLLYQKKLHARMKEWVEELKRSYFVERQES